MEDSRNISAAVSVDPYSTLPVTEAGIQSRDRRDASIMDSYITEVIKKMEQSKILAELPLTVRKRVRALRKLQLETTNIDAEFYRKVYDLERSFQEKHNKIFLKRRDILMGDYEPTEDECDYPDPENFNEITQAFAPTSGSEMTTPSTTTTADTEDGATSLAAKGIPNFWLNIMKYVPLLGSMVKECDEPVLKYLTDVTVVSKPLPDLSFTLQFHFAPNEYFENAILSKEYLMKCIPDNDDPFAFDGPEIYCSFGCTINWKEGKNVTFDQIKKNDDSQVKDTKIDSFFNFFNPPEIPKNENHPDYDDITNLLETDFEIGYYIKDRIIPRAILYYTAEANDNLSDSIQSSLSDEVATDDEEETHQEEGEGDASNIN